MGAVVLERGREADLNSPFWLIATMTRDWGASFFLGGGGCAFRFTFWALSHKEVRNCKLDRPPGTAPIAAYMPTG